MNGEYAGVLPTFGVAEASRESGDTRGATGCSFRFDVTGAVQKLQAEDENFDASNLEVRSVPDDQGEPGLESVGDEEGPDQGDFEIGRVSVYLA